MVYVMPNTKKFYKVADLCFISKEIWKAKNLSKLKRFEIILNSTLLKKYLMYNKIDNKIVATLSQDVVNDAFAMITERIQKEKEANEKEFETKRLLEEVFDKVMKKFQKED